jgi:hypothetical protein
VDGTVDPPSAIESRREAWSIHSSALVLNR